eukprot:8978117-Alexandrium_andersonii.AAC.1
MQDEPRRGAPGNCQAPGEATSRSCRGQPYLAHAHGGSESAPRAGRGPTGCIRNAVPPGAPVGASNCRGQPRRNRCAQRRAWPNAHAQAAASAPGVARRRARRRPRESRA